MPTIKIEGQTIKGDSVGITDEIANDDELLKAALAPTWPDVRTATFQREGGKDGKELVVRVQKKAGTKGMDASEIEEQERHDRRMREKDRVRKLEDVALAAAAYVDCDEELQVLCGAIDKLGDDEITRIRDARSAVVTQELGPADRARLEVAESSSKGDK
jgi:hypothetical protein